MAIPSSLQRSLVPFVTGYLVLLLAWLSQWILAWLPLPTYPGETLCLLGVAGVSSFFAAAVAAAKAKRGISEAFADCAPFVLPAAAAGLVAAAVYALYPAAVRGHDFLAAIVPLILIFYVIGALYSMLRSQSEQERRIRFILPPVIATLLIGGYVTIQIMNSLEYEYRNAFAFQIDNIDYRSPEVSAKATLEIKKPGEYRFSAHSYAASTNTSANYTKLQWDKPPKSGEIGTYKVDVRWSKGDAVSPTQSAERSPVEHDDDFTVFEIRREKDDAVLRQFWLTPNSGV